MPKIVFKKITGEQIEVEASEGKTIMQAALDHDIEEIVAECGGNCICATCHCLIDEAWTEKTGEPAADEIMMLDMSDDRKENSRLSCQIKMTEHLNGVVVHLLESQY